MLGEQLASLVAPPREQLFLASKRQQQQRSIDMPEKIQGVCSASPSDYGNPIYDSSTTTVRLGETNLLDVARNRGVDPSAALAENPQISSLYTPLLLGQEVHLPICQAPEEQSLPVPGDQYSTAVPAHASSGDPLTKSVVQANLKSNPELPPDEARVKQALGEDGLRTYREVKKRIHHGATNLPADWKNAPAQAPRPDRDHRREMDDPIGALRP
jgi:hypothetical protein